NPSQSYDDIDYFLCNYHIIKNFSSEYMSQGFKKDLYGKLLPVKYSMMETFSQMNDFVHGRPLGSGSESSSSSSSSSSSRSVQPVENYVFVFKKLVDLLQEGLN